MVHTSFRGRRLAASSAAFLALWLLVGCGSGSTPAPPGPTAPSITTQPSNQTVNSGQTATFTVLATGTAPLSYQWLKGSTNISGATSASYTTPATAAADDGSQFKVTISNAGGSVTSNTATLTVNSSPLITTQPSNQTVTVGQTATFAVVATGAAPLSYQWQKGGISISGATAASYTTPATIAADNGSQFTVAVSNSVGNITSNIATLTVNLPPSITTQPANQTVKAGQTATFTVAATGTAPLSYQWQKGGVNISGATAASYTTPATTASDNGSQFKVTVSNVAGSVSSNAATLTVNSPPAISTQPANQSVLVGQTATFGVVASGTAPLSYQWQKAGVNISGATAATYTTPATLMTDNGTQFDVVVTNPYGTATSNPATLTVTATVVDVTTYHYDNTRSGANLQETILTPANVNSTTFGKIGFYSVDGLVDGQPLYLSQVNVGGVNHNILYAVTEHASAYAFDADSGTILWQVSLLGTGESTSDNRGCPSQVTPEIGITSTPVIDRARGPNGALYTVVMSKDASNNYFQRVHALDVVSGAELFGGPVAVQATYPGTGDGSSNGTVTFDPKQYKERAGLLLSNGVLYTTWASHCDNRPYTGWIIGYDASTLTQVQVLNVTPNGNDGAIWMAGAAPAADVNGDIYFLDGNGTFDTTLDTNGFPNKGDFGNSFLKLSTTTGTLAVSDYFTMSNTVVESNTDEDLGSGGAVVLLDVMDSGGHAHQLAVGAGKDKVIYVVDRNLMGKFNPTTNNIYQQISGALNASVFSKPAVFNNTVYYGAVGDVIRAFPVSNALLATSASSKTSNTFKYPGATPSVSASGTSNAILWAVENTNPAVLHAYDATNLATELYNTNQAAGSRDQFGNGNKFITPIVVNGKVFVGTPNGVAVFGLLP